MFAVFQRYLTAAFQTRLLIILLDGSIAVCSFAFATLLRLNFEVPHKVAVLLPNTLLLILVVRFITFRLLKTYSGLVRYTGESDVKRVVVATTLGSLGYCFICFARLGEGQLLLSYSILLIDYFLLIVLLSGYRLFIRMLYRSMNVERHQQPSESIAIFGAGNSGLLTKKAIDNQKKSGMKVVAFLDDNPRLAQKSIEGIPIYHAASFDKAAKRHRFHKLIIASQSVGAARKKELIDFCFQQKILAMSIPPVDRWLNGQLNVRQIKSVKIEDLLHRPEIRLSMDNICQYLAGKRILITGAAGSIGSEMVRQVLSFNPEKILLLDQAETPLSDLHISLQERFGAFVQAVVADITDHQRIRQLFQEFNPQVVFHAAAYKHVPVMELNPYEAVRTNVLGTCNLAELAKDFGVERFVMVSTDKAVNPSNVMGASKRIAEMYVQALGNLPETTTQFITTRFGNVMGSNGSVIPLFRKQIAEGGPVTVTHPEVTRYFMTIPEACQLVLEAGSMGKGSEIFLFDMGECVKIADLAKKMIQLSDLQEGKDIQIVFTGLRPGEKLYEELLNVKENTLPTHHEKIMIAQVSTYGYDAIRKAIMSLDHISKTNDTFALVKKMKEIIPEFVSSASKYEVLDRPKKIISQHQMV